MPPYLYIKQRSVISMMMTIDLLLVPDLILNVYAFILLLYDVSSFATHKMLPSLASDGQENEFEYNFEKNLNNDCQQSYKYKKSPQHMALEINVMSWNKHKNTTGVYHFNGFP